MRDPGAVALKPPLPPTELSPGGHTGSWMQATGGRGPPQTSGPDSRRVTPSHDPGRSRHRSAPDSRADRSGPRPTGRIPQATRRPPAALNTTPELRMAYVVGRRRGRRWRSGGEGRETATWAVGSMERLNLTVRPFSKFAGPAAEVGGGSRQRPRVSFSGCRRGGLWARTESSNPREGWPAPSEVCGSGLG